MSEPMSARELAEKIYFDDDGTGKTSVDRITALIARAREEDAKMIAHMQTIIDAQKRNFDAASVELIGRIDKRDATIKELREALGLIEKDPHQFSSRPCSTCAEISCILKRAYGCEIRRAALAEKQRQEAEARAKDA